MSDSQEPHIILYTTQTPNGNKASILLEELNIPYRVYKHNFSARTHKEPWYLDINPNGKIPAITDVFCDGREIHIWESGNVLKYLVEQYDPDFKLWYPHGSRENYELFSWVGLYSPVSNVSKQLIIVALLPGQWHWPFPGSGHTLPAACAGKNPICTRQIPQRVSTVICSA